ncbi:sensor histidine kinase [Deinococcus pimensis]|uniref:sensor histidine kinase n=1 Tax=Deinococcus pimensis TaxID=309888 RepID=UPI0009FE7B76|nr:HAMP domain-containing sensor histidine kinase [Deinococcus pimensis]
MTEPPHAPRTPVDPAPGPQSEHPGRKRPFWHTVAFKLTLAFVLIAALALGAVGVIANVSTRASFERFTRERARDEIVTQVQSYIETTGSVTGFRPFRRGRHGAADNVMSPNATGPDRGPYVVLDPEGRTTYALPDVPAGTRLTGERASLALPVELGGRTVAFVAPTLIPQSLDRQSREFLARTTSALLWATIAATIAAIVLGLLMARALLAPLRALLRGIWEVQRGEAPGQAPRARADEFGEVLTAFHEMHDVVVRNQQSRRQLTANIAHDLNTPLSVISGTLEAMLDGTFKVTPERLARLHREARHMGELVNDLRFLSLADAGELKLDLRDEDLVEVVALTVDGVQELARRKQVELNVRLPHGPLHARLDGRRVTQVIQNLLSNALAYTPGGGQVDVTVERGAGRAVVMVRDTGVGIVPEKLPFVFDRLYRADEARVKGGSGLGLAICKSIVERHDGRIEIESTPGVGTTVTFDLPLARSPRTAPQP